jgi:lipoprotein NlpD
VTQRPAPVDDRRAAPAAQPRLQVLQPAPTGPRSYIVKRGDTLYSIALEQGVDYRELAQLNRIEDPSKIRLGQELRLPASEREVPGSGRRHAPSGAKSRRDRWVQAHPVLRLRAIRWRRRHEDVAQGAAACLIPSRTSLRFPGARRSPKQGPKPRGPQRLPRPSAPSAAASNGIRTDRFRLAGAWQGCCRPSPNRTARAWTSPAGRATRCSPPPAGRVMYTGTGIRGYGKLIVIKHDKQLQQRLRAQPRDPGEGRPERDARPAHRGAGATTDADTPKLHFEIRKSGKPVDPARYLPAFLINPSEVLLGRILVVSMTRRRMCSCSSACCTARATGTSNPRAGPDEGLRSAPQEPVRPDPARSADAGMDGFQVMEA